MVYTLNKYHIDTPAINLNQGKQMPVFSYVAIPKKGAKDRLCSELASLSHCDVIPADNQDVVVLVTDTPDGPSEKSLQKSLKSLQSLQSLSMAFGYEDNDNNGK